MSARLLGPASVVRCERERVYAHLAGKVRAKLGYARMRLARAELFAPRDVRSAAWWSWECARWERVAKYLARRHRLAQAFGV